MGQLAQAKHLFYSAIEQAQRGDVAEYEAEAHWYLGTLAQQEGDLDSASKSVKLAITLAQACNYPWLISAALNTLAEILTEQGAQQQAIEIYLQALQYAEKIGSRQQCAACCHALSLLYEGVGEAQLALSYAPVVTMSLPRK